MTIPNSILEKFIDLWKDETGTKLSVNQAISKLRLISTALDADKRSHSSLKADLLQNSNHKQK